PQAEVTEDFLGLNEQLASVQRDALAAGQLVEAPLADVKSRLEQLGPVPTGSRESSDIAAQRRELTVRQSRLDDVRKRADLLGLDARQAATHVEQVRAEKFNRDLATRSPSPLSPALWRGLARQWPDDAARLWTV